MSVNFDTVITNKMLDLIKQGHLDSMIGKRFRRPYNPVNHQSYSKESAVFLGVVESSFENSDPRFCTVDEARAINWLPTPGMEGNFVRKRVLYTEDPFGYPLEKKDWKFRDTPQLVFNGEQFQNIDTPVSYVSDTQDVLDHLCEAFNSDAVSSEDKLFDLALKGITAYNAKRAEPFHSLDADLRVEMASMLLAMDFDAPMPHFSSHLWKDSLEADPTEFRKAASDADLISSYIKHFSEEASKTNPILREDALIEYAASVERPIDFFNKNELAYVRMQNMKYLLDCDANLRKNRPELVQRNKQIEKEIKAQHVLKPSMMKRLDLFVGKSRNSVENIISSFASEGLSWRILPMKKLIRSIDDLKSDKKKSQMAQ